MIKPFYVYLIETRAEQKEIFFLLSVVKERMG